MSTYEIASPRKPYKVVGERPIRHDGYDKVTGKAIYGADISLPGMLYGKVLRSPHAHARIRAIDTSRVEAHPDIRAVVTHKDLPAADDRLAEVDDGRAQPRHAYHSALLQDPSTARM